VLDALAKSNEPDKAVRARALLDKLLQMHKETRNPNLRPSQVPFNTVLNAAAFSKSSTTEEQRREALQVAVQTFSRLRMYDVPPDEVSYGNILKCIHNLMPAGPTRTTMALNVFEKCRQEGFVGDLVWNEIRRVVPNDKLSAVVPLRKSLGSARVGDLPVAWRCNTKKRRRRAGQSPTNQSRSNAATTTGRQRDAPVRRFRNISESSYQSGRDV